MNRFFTILIWLLVAAGFLYILFLMFTTPASNHLG